MEQQTWMEPPAPRGCPGQKTAGGMTATGLTATELGDAVEATLAQLLGWDPANEDRIGPFDLRDDEDVYEVKAVTAEATEYKAKPKKHEVQGKLAYAAAEGLRPHMVIAVVDGEMVHAYARPGIGAFRLTTPEAGWTYLGTSELVR